MITSAQLVVLRISYNMCSHTTLLLLLLLLVWFRAVVCVNSTGTSMFVIWVYDFAPPQPQPPDNHRHTYIRIYVLQTRTEHRRASVQTYIHTHRWYWHKPIYTHVLVHIQSELLTTPLVLFGFYIVSLYNVPWGKPKFPKRWRVCNDGPKGVHELYYVWYGSAIVYLLIHIFLLAHTVIYIIKWNT